MDNRSLTKIVRSPIVYIVPALLIFCVLFCGGLLLAFIQSIVIPATIRTEAAVNFNAYITLLTSKSFYASLLHTISIATISTVIATVGGVFSALVIRHSAKNSALIRFAYQLPLSVPHLIAAIGFSLLLSQSGLLSRLLYALNILEGTAQFPILTHDTFGVGIIITYIWKELPFIAIITLTTLQGLGTNYEQVAITLGAKKSIVFKKVLLPLIAPAVIPASIIVFAFIFGSYEVPFILGSSYPSMLSILAYRSFINPDLSMRQLAMALNIIIAGIVIALGFVYLKMYQRLKLA